MLLGDWYEEEGGGNGWSDTVWVRHWLGVVSIGDTDTGAGHRSSVCSWADSQTHMIGDSSLLSTLVAVQLSGGFSAARAAKGRLKSQAFLTVRWGVPTSQGMCPKTWSGRTEADQWPSFLGWQWECLRIIEMFFAPIKHVEKGDSNLWGWSSHFWKLQYNPGDSDLWCDWAPGTRTLELSLEESSSLCCMWCTVLIVVVFVCLTLMSFLGASVGTKEDFVQRPYISLQTYWKVIPYWPNGKESYFRQELGTGKEKSKEERNPWSFASEWQEEEI